jgi:single-strand DNA-binding protein
MYELTGKIKVIFDTQTFPSGFTKREFVVTTEDKYPQDIKLTLVKDKTELIEAFDEGDDVTTSFDLRGNEYKEKFYVDLNAWKIQKAEGSGSGSDSGSGSESASAADEEPDAEGDFPF